MVFSSSLFMFIFLPITLLGYYVLDSRLKNLWLLLASLFFYAWGEPKNIIWMLLSIVVNYLIGLAIEKYNGQKTVLLILGIIFNVSLLMYFKYFNFFINNVNYIFNSGIELTNIALPIGISFYTFQIMSYTIDVYKGNVKAQKNLLDLALYVSLFPQLIAGPIVRYIDIQEQIHNRKHTIEKFNEGVRLFMIGFSKKVLIADKVCNLADIAFAAENPDIILAWLGAIAYTLQIYFDFSGYSDMARGLGKMFGFEFMVNFDHPYISNSIKEFWRRWHISLSTWFRDYVYIPLGGSRCGKFKTYRNLIIIFFLTGFWHGASWNFIVWGLYYVVFLIIERMGFGKWLENRSIIIQKIYTLFVAIIGWVFFRAEGLRKAFDYLKHMFTFTNIDIGIVNIVLNKEILFFMLIAIIFSMPMREWFNKKVLKRKQLVSDILLAGVFMIAIFFMVGSGFSPFLYFRF